MPRSAILLLSCALPLAGCAAPTARVPVLRPAPVNLSAYELVAVDRFEGSAGSPTCEQLSTELADALRSSVNPLTGEVEYDVLARSDVDRTVDNLRAGSPGQGVDDRAMQILERWRSADVLVRGRVLDAEVTDDVVEQSTSDAEGNVRISYRREVVARLVVEIETAEPSVAGDAAFDRVTLEETVAASTVSADPAPPAIDYEPMLADARRRIVSQYIGRVLPREEFVVVELRTADELPDLEIGNGYAQVGDWDAAIQSYMRAVEQSQGVTPKARASALYDFGIACCYTNRFEDAREALRESYALDRNRRTLSELQNVDWREQEFAELVAQGATAATPQR